MADETTEALIEERQRILALLEVVNLRYYKEIDVYNNLLDALIKVEEIIRLREQSG